MPPPNRTLYTTYNIMSFQHVKSVKSQVNRFQDAVELEQFRNIVPAFLSEAFVIVVVHSLIELTEIRPGAVCSSMRSFVGYPEVVKTPNEPCWDKNPEPLHTRSPSNSVCRATEGGRELGCKQVCHSDLLVCSAFNYLKQKLRSSVFFDHLVLTLLHVFSA